MNFLTRAVVFRRRQQDADVGNGTNIVLAGGCFHKLCHRNSHSTITDLVEMLDLASAEGWREAHKLENKIANMVLANVRSTLAMVGGLCKDFGILVNRTQTEAFHNTSLENKNTDTFERSAIGLTTYRRESHSLVPVDIADVC